MKGPVRFINFAIDNHYGKGLLGQGLILKYAFKDLSPILLIYSTLIIVC